jgi:pimeloyl-ACP methyl ester carboxylesterase
MVTMIIGKNGVVIRGHLQDIYYVAGSGVRAPDKPIVLFVPGDGGWRGFAVTMAQTIASWGYDVYGLDTRRYLESSNRETVLNEADVIADFHQIAGWITSGQRRNISLVGWSEGAGLCVLAASAETNKQTFKGVVTLGLPESNVLSWHWIDNITYITGQAPNEPAFRSADYIGRVSPLRLWMIESTHDEYVPVAAANALFTTAHEPKRFSLIDARNHRFEGNQPQMFGTLREGLAWLTMTD